MSNRILRVPDVKKITGLSRTTIYKLVKEQDFPSPIKLSKKAIGWPESTIENWIKQRIDACDSNVNSAL